MPNKTKKINQITSSLFDTQQIQSDLFWGSGFALFRIIAFPEEEVTISQALANAVRGSLSELNLYIKNEGLEILSFWWSGFSIGAYINFLNKKNLGTIDQEKSKNAKANSLVSDDFKSEFLVAVRENNKNNKSDSLSNIFFSSQELNQTIETLFKDIPFQFHKNALKDLWKNFLNKNNKSEVFRLIFGHSIEIRDINFIIKEINFSGETINNIYNKNLFNQSYAFLNKIKEIKNTQVSTYHKGLAIIQECSGLKIKVYNYFVELEKILENYRNTLSKLLHIINNYSFSENEYITFSKLSIDFLILNAKNYGNLLLECKDYFSQDTQCKITFYKDKKEEIDTVAENAITNLITNFETNFLDSNIVKLVAKKSDLLNKDTKIFLNYLTTITGLNESNNFNTAEPILDAISPYGKIDQKQTENLSLLFQNNFIRIIKKIETKIYQVLKEFKVFFDTVCFEENEKINDWINSNEKWNFFIDLNNKIYIFENAIYEIEDQLLFLIRDEFNPLFQICFGLKKFVDVKNKDLLLNEMPQLHEDLGNYLNNILFSNNEKQLKGFVNLINSFQILKEKLFEFQEKIVSKDIKKILITWMYEHFRQEIHPNFIKKWKNEFENPFLQITESLNLTRILKALEPKVSNITTILNPEILESKNPIFSIFKYLNDRILFYLENKLEVSKIKDYFDKAIINIHHNANLDSRLLIKSYQEIYSNSSKMLAILTNSSIAENFNNSQKVTELKLYTRKFFQNRSQENAIINEIIEQNTKFKVLVSDNYQLLNITSIAVEESTNIKLANSLSANNNLLNITNVMGKIIENIDSFFISFKDVIKDLLSLKVYLGNKYPEIKKLIKQSDEGKEIVSFNKSERLINKNNIKYDQQLLINILENSYTHENIYQPLLYNKIDNVRNMNHINISYLITNWWYLALLSLPILTIGSFLLGKKFLFHNKAELSSLPLLSNEEKEKNFYISELHTIIFVITNIINNNANLTSKFDFVNLIKIKYFLLDCIKKSEASNNFDFHLQPLLSASKKQVYSINNYYQKNKNFVYQENLESLTIINEKASSNSQHNYSSPLFNKIKKLISNNEKIEDQFEEIMLNEQETLLSSLKEKNEQEIYKGQPVELDSLLDKVNSIKIAMKLEDENQYWVILVTLLKNEKYLNENHLLGFGSPINFEKEDIELLLNNNITKNSINLNAFLAIENSYLIKEMQDILDWHNNSCLLEVEHNF